jgi:7-cyano-7-deazaguanine synthase in queuosine biosynthesis
LGFKPSAARFAPNGISLFSGGLDSAIGAIDSLNRGEALLLASTAGERQTAGPQNRVFEALKMAFPDAVLEHVHQSVVIPSALKEHGENSQRARSILFLAFGTFIASCFAPNQVPLTVAENGLIALNVAPRANRMASNSTKTTHPFFLARVRETLKALGIGMDLREPYRFVTKGEMVAAADPVALARIMPETVSCAKAAQLFHQRTGLLHCGSCAACIIRRAAIAAGWKGADPTPGYFYTPNLAGETVLADNSRGGDIRAFKAAADKLAADQSRALVDVYRSGPMSDVRLDIGRYASVYARGLGEVGSLLATVATVGV